MAAAPAFRHTERYRGVNERRGLLQPDYRLPARGPRPGEPLWSFQKDQSTWSAELRDHGAAGVEAQILQDGELVIGRRFDRRELAVQWAEQERQAIKRGQRK